MRVYYFSNYSVADTVGYVTLDVVFYQLMVCAVIIAFNLFALDIATATILHSIVSLGELLSTIVPTYIYCSLSEYFTANLLEIGEVFYASTWYNFRVKYQKLLKMPIMRSQREVRLSGLGLIDCSLNVFLSVNTSTLAFLP